MNLINFQKNENKLAVLVKKIGATYPTIDFASPWQSLNISELDIALNNEGIDIDSSKLEVNISDNTFMYEGRRVLVYIRDQRGSYYNGDFKISDYRFHIVNCRTIDEFRKKGKFNRYVVSTRTDNQFLCNIITGQDELQNKYNQLRELKICKNCLDQLCYLNYCNKRRKEEKDELQESFNLVDYFNKYNGTFVSKPRFTDNNQPLGIYPDNWPETSRQIRVKYNWECQGCKNNFSHKKAHLDTHHIDSNPGNCEESNLLPLCKDCHKKVHRK